MTDPFAHDRFLVEQLLRPVVNLYRVSPLAEGDTAAGEPVAFVRQKRMKIKEDIRFFADEAESEELFRIKARQVFEIGGRYDVTTADGTRVGVLEKVFGRSLLRSTWRVLDADEQALATAQERSLPMAIARRLVDFVPYGELVPIPYNFDILVDGARVGGMMRKFQLRDRYVLDLSGDPDRRIDRRVAVALAIGLDTLQNR
ncbi:MAG TPA: hypothetical protein VFI37_09405 [Gaiellaceae bacterium]|nr:hypothetical protein [Gaiellaceae bacterium]